MRRSNQPWLLRHAPGVLAILFVVLGLVPLRFLGWAEWFSTLAATIFAPISHPLTVVSAWLNPATREASDEELRELNGQLEAARRLLWRAERENALLAERLDALQKGAAVRPDIRVDQIVRRVIASSSDPSSGVLRLRAGDGDGVSPSVVATVRGEQLLGRVQQVDALTCTVRPITDRAAGSLRGAVVLDASNARWVPVELSPTGLGTLRGRAAYALAEEGRAQPLEPRVGMTVRLDDAEWPASAQGLVVGVVERVEPDQDQPLRRVVTVRPSVELRRVSEVVLRIPLEDGRPAGDTPPKERTP